MFSRRFKWDLEPTRFARLIEEKKRAGARLLDLTESNPTRAGSLLLFDQPRKTCRLKIPFESSGKHAE
jgi:hypothetical protein